MNEMMAFPDTWEEFEKSYGFTDNEEVYTNGARLIPSFRVKQWLAHLPSVQPDLGKYEYHYDHTDCIWYRPEARNRCPVTCAQYRDGWNDAMNYIFRDGKCYRPYRRGEQYEE